MSWSAAERFPGDTLLVAKDDPGWQLEAGSGGWYERRSSQATRRVDLAYVIANAGDEHREFVIAATGRILMQACGDLRDSALATLVEGSVPLDSESADRLRALLADVRVLRQGRLSEQ